MCRQCRDEPTHVMGALAVVLRAWNRSDSTSTGEHETDTESGVRVRCRNCGRYYVSGPETCPHCGSGNQIHDGWPSGQTARR